MQSAGLAVVERMERSCKQLVNTDLLVKPFLPRKTLNVPKGLAGNDSYLAVRIQYY